MLEAFGKTAIVIHERSVIFQNAAFHFEIVDAPREWIGKRLKNKDGKRLCVVVFALYAVALAARLLEAHLGVLIGMRENVRQESEQAGGANVVERGNHQNRKDFFSDDGAADCRN